MYVVWKFRFRNQLFCFFQNLFQSSLLFWYNKFDGSGWSLQNVNFRPIDSIYVTYLSRSAPRTRDRQLGKVVKVNRDNFSKLNISWGVGKIVSRVAISTENTTRRTVIWIVNMSLRCEDVIYIVVVVILSAKFVSRVACTTMCWQF
jgi:hypothetical protein